MQACKPTCGSVRLLFACGCLPRCSSLSVLDSGDCEDAYGRPDSGDADEPNEERKVWRKRECCDMFVGGDTVVGDGAPGPDAPS